MGGRKPGMTDKLDRFCHEYIVDFNATQAAIRAGYTKNRAADLGYQNLKKECVQARIKELLAPIQSKNIADATEVMEMLTATMRGETTEDVVVGIGEGVQSITEKTVGGRERVKAAELLGKRYGLFQDKVRLEGNVSAGVTIVDDIE